MTRSKRFADLVWGFYECRPASEEVRRQVEELLEPRRNIVLGPHRNNAERIRGVSEQDNLDRTILGQREMGEGERGRLGPHLLLARHAPRIVDAEVHRSRFLLAAPQLVDQERV